jgi:hypothetical protein
MEIEEILYILLGVYMFLGFLSFEWAWASVKSIRKVDEERDSKYPAFRRWDVNKWKKWKFYFGAMTLMPIRLFCSIILLIICYILVK